MKHRILDYSRMPLLELAGRIVGSSDRTALDELHDNRRLLVLRSGEILPMSIADYIESLMSNAISNEWCGGDPVVLDQAYGLTMKKFSSIPPENESELKYEGPDCRYYFKAFIEHATGMLRKGPIKSCISREAKTTEMLRKMVFRHFHFSCLECRRKSQRFVRRYVWQKNGSSITILMPIGMPGDKCHDWLEKNIPNADFAKHGERGRVQEIIDRLLPRGTLVSLDNIVGSEEFMADRTALLSSAIEEEISVNGLAQTIANEKADNIEEQRPAIQSLGKAKLEKMICTIFEYIADGKYDSVKVCKKFRVSKATMSRFAGMRWSGQNGEAPYIPDLWRNTAHVLAHHEVFITAAKKAGVWEKVSLISNKSIVMGGKHNE